jgi:dihydrofolate reductase
MQMSLDGFVEGPDGDMSWLITDNDEDWNEMFDDLKNVDTFLLGRKMYPGYADYWRSILSNPSSPKNELKYAQLADKTTHIVFTHSDLKTDWKNTRVAKDPTEEIARLKKENGKDIMVWGGANFASNLINLGLIDEFRITLNPTLVGDGKSFSKELNKTKPLKFVSAKPLKSGLIILKYQS